MRHVALLLLLSQANMAAGSTTAQPNIVFVIADDLGWADVGYHGSEDIKTPNIDRLAASGARLESFYSQPMCTPTRAALLTGRYPMRYGLQSFVITPGQHYGLPTDEYTLAQSLKDAGYKTYALGKWHLGHGRKDYWPQNRGFDYFYGTTIGNVDYYTKERAGIYDWQRNGEQLKEEGYITDLITKDAVRIIEQQPGDEPFFLYLAHLAVHSPYQAPEEYINRYQGIDDNNRRVYAAMATALDDSLGQVLAALEQKGIRDNTIVIFVSDNGGLAGKGYSGAMAKVRDKPAPANNGPYRDSKGSLYEGAVRVPGIVNWPGHVQPLDVTEVIHMVDWFPTLSKLVGGASGGKTSLDGKDVWQVITAGAASPHEHILINAEFHRGAVRKGDWKLIKFAALPSRVELYNVANDPSEKMDLSERFPNKVAELELLLNDYAKQSKPALYFKEYMPFIKQDTKTATMVFEGDEDSGHSNETPTLAK